MNKGHGKRRARGRPKKRRGKDKLPKFKAQAKRDDEEEERKPEDSTDAEVMPPEVPAPVIKEEKEEMEEEEEIENEEEEESFPAQTVTTETSPSTSSAAPEAVVAQLNQLQETVVSHILQYQAGVMAQFQQIQQQMLAELSSSSQPQVQQLLSSMTSTQPQVQQMLSEMNSPTQPQVTLTPILQVKPNVRKRRASVMTNGNEENGKVGEMAFKRKRTAFTEKQYQILETTFVHNNFPEPIDQHCIALRIKTPYKSIKMWFQNRRASIRKRMIHKEKDVDKIVVKEEEEEDADTENKNTKCGNDPDTRWYCVKCPSTFITKQFLDAHIEAHDFETLHCSDCNMAFTHRVLLDTHKISKCTSKTGVELSHLNDEHKSKEAIERHKSKKNFMKVLNNEYALKLQTNEEPTKEVEAKDVKPSLPPPLVEPNMLLQFPNLQENPLFMQQQRLMQQLLLVQLQQAAQLKAKQQSEKLEEQLSPKESETCKDSLTLGGLTIFPVKASGTGEVKIKEEIKQPPPEDSEECQQPSTLQDQITSILQSQGLKSAWKYSGIKEEEEDSDSKPGIRESMKEQIEAIIRHQENRKKALKLNFGGPQNGDDMELDDFKRHRRRTTVFNEVQLRTLYMHFTHCNFPDPAMFKIIGHLISLDPQVIKIWFQNERSRQRKRATHIVDEVTSKVKPYKCRDCGMSFAMLTFLVKHSMRHVGETDQDSSVRTCPLCLQKWNKEVFSSHLKSRHNVNLSLVEERTNDDLKCYLCSEKFSDQEALMIHKHKHLKDEYGDPPQCSQCKTTFVNAICLEAHMETHETGEWTHKCTLCRALFHDKILLTSHKMGHGVPMAPVSTIDRSRSQLQHSSIRKTVATAVTSLNKSSLEDCEMVSDSESVKSEKGILSIVTSMSSPVSSDQFSVKDILPKATASNMTTVIPTIITSSPSASLLSPTIPTFITSSPVTSSSVAPTQTTTVPTLITSRMGPTVSASNVPSSPPNGPVSFVKLIPVQLIPTSPIPTSQSGSKTSSQGSFLTAPTTAYISVPVSILGANESACNPILNQLLDSSTAFKLVDDKSGKKKGIPNLIPISPTVIPKDDVKTDPEVCVPDSANVLAENRENELSEKEKEDPEECADTALNCDSESAADEENKVSIESNDSEDKFSQEELNTRQADNRKRYVPILPMIPMQVENKDIKAPSNSTSSVTLIPKRPKSSRNVTNKRLWDGLKLEGYKLRRSPVCFSGRQREILEAHFDHDNFPLPGEQIALADQLGVDYAVVRTWFQNARKNIRKKMKLNRSKEGQGGPFHCQKCKVSFISDASLKEHTEVHSLNTGIRCDKCDINFSHDHVLKNHQIVCHSKGDFFKRKKFGIEVLDRFLRNKAQCDGETEEASDSDTEYESSMDAIKREFLDMGTSVKSEKVAEDSFEDGEDYHPIMAVECILDNSGDEVQKPGDVNEQSGHKCSSCGESFASLIAFKEHHSHHCIREKSLKPGHFRRRKKLFAKRKSKSGNSIRCFDCYNVFSDRNSYLEHFGSFPCNSGRQRIEYTDEEQKILFTHYDSNNFPLPSEMTLLARRLGVRYRQIMHWFQNRRSKERKKQREGGKLPPVECQNCKVSFVTEENLKRHMKTIHEEGSGSLMEHVCQVKGCDAYFPNAELLVTHSLVHQIDTDAIKTEEENDTPKLPSLGSTSPWTDVAVLEAHFTDNNFPDPMDIGFIARRLKVDPLRVHMWFKERRSQHIQTLEENGQKVMEGEKAVSVQKAMSKACSKCDAAFICQSDLVSHEEMHKSSWAQACSMCQQEFSTVVVLETHWIRHGIEVPKDMSVSPERASKASFSSVQLQVLETHYENNNFPVALEIWLIALRLKLRPIQVTHWFQNKRGRDRRFQKIKTPYSRICGLCGASFICDLFLNNHIKHHKSYSRHPCSECSAVFLSPILKETHALYHTNVPNDKTSRGKDPMIEGQVKDGEGGAEDGSDVSEGELQIDESEGFKICLENNEDDISENVNDPTIEENSELPDAEYEPSIEENSLEDIVTYDETTDVSPVEENNSDDKSEPQPSDSCMVKEVDGDANAEPFDIKKHIREEYFFDDDDEESDDDDEDEPRLKIVSAYTISGNPEDIELEEDL